LNPENSIRKLSARVYLENELVEKALRAPVNAIL